MTAQTTPDSARVSSLSSTLSQLLDQGHSPQHRHCRDTSEAGDYSSSSRHAEGQEHLHDGVGEALEVQAFVHGGGGLAWLLQEGAGIERRVLEGCKNSGWAMHGPVDMPAGFWEMAEGRYGDAVHLIWRGVGEQKGVLGAVFADDVVDNFRTLGCWCAGPGPGCEAVFERYGPPVVVDIGRALP